MRLSLSEQTNPPTAEPPPLQTLPAYIFAASYSETIERERFAREQAEKENRAKDEFFAFFLHELRNPLNAVNGWTQMLSAGKLDSARTSEAIQTIQRNANFLNDLIDDLLDVSRIINNQMPLQTAAVDLRQIIENALEDFSPAANQRNIILIGSFVQTKCVISGDAKRLLQIIGNLLNNSLKFTPSGGFISIDLQTVNEAVEIKVKDSGTGIKADFLPFVFERFRQEKGQNTIHNKGFGLGLAVAKYLVELHGGTIQAASNGEGCGALFTINFPAFLTK